MKAAAVLAELGAGGDRLAQHVPRGDVGDAEAVDQALGLRTFAGAWRADEDHSHEGSRCGG
jgi:hypothetical protein